MPSDEFGESPGDFQVWFGMHRGIPIKEVPRWYIDLCIHPDKEAFHWFDRFRRLVEAYNSSLEYPGDVELWFGKYGDKGVPIKKLPRDYIDWCTLPDQEDYKWFRQFKGLVELYDSKLEHPGGVKVWFGRFKRTPIKDVPRWYIDYATHPAQAEFRWHLGFKRLFNAHRKILPEVKPGTELLWFGVPKYRGKALNEVYHTDRRYMLWCADPKRASSTWYPEFMRTLNNYLEKREKRPYRPRARTELIRDTGDKCGPWDDDQRLKDDEYDTTDGFVEPDPDWEPEGWEDYEALESQGYKEESDVEWIGDAIAGEDEESDSYESETEEEGVVGGGQRDDKEEEEEEEEEASFTDGRNEATSSGSEESQSDQDLAWSVASSNDIIHSDVEAASGREENVEVSTPRKRIRAKRMVVDSEDSDGALPSPSCLFALKHEDDGQNAISSEEEMDTIPRTPKRRAVKQVVVSSDDESDTLESRRLGDRVLGSPGNEPPITPMMKGCLETPTPGRYPKRTRKQVSRYADQKSSQDDEGSEGDDESLAHRTPLKRRKTVVSGRAH